MNASLPSDFKHNWICEASYSGCNWRHAYLQKGRMTVTVVLWPWQLFVFCHVLDIYFENMKVYLHHIWWLCLFQDVRTWQSLQAGSGAWQKSKYKLESCPFSSDRCWNINVMSRVCFCYHSSLFSKQVTSGQTVPQTTVCNIGIKYSYGTFGIIKTSLSFATI